MLEIRTILVPMDFSAHSEKALSTAVDLARKFEARIHLLHCYRIDVFALLPYGPQYTADLPEDFDRGIREAARKKLRERSAAVVSEGISVEDHLSGQLPSDAILRIAEEVSADLIVMGTRGLTGLKHVLLGSVAERTIRAAPCPVLTVKDDAG